MPSVPTSIAEKNLALQDELYRLRAETQASFDETKALQARWKEVEKEQKDVYSVGLLHSPKTPYLTGRRGYNRPSSLCGFGMLPRRRKTFLNKLLRPL